MRAKGKFTKAVALKILSNVLKGWPPLKPNKGEHGEVSWLAAEDSKAYTGVSPDADVEITFEWTPAGNDVTKDERWVLEILAYTKSQNQTMPKAAMHRLTWDEMGKDIATQALNDGIVAVKVPKSELSASGAGCFFLINSANAHRLKVVGNLEQALTSRFRTDVESVTQKIDNNSQTRARSFTVTVSGWGASNGKLIDFMKGVWGAAMTPTFQTGSVTCTGGELNGVTCRVQFISKGSATVTASNYTQAKHLARALARKPETQIALPTNHQWPENWKH